MMRRNTGILVAVIAVLAAAATSQVRRVRTGGTLDANYRIGSGGINPRTGSPGSFNSQLYVTGQVTGLAGFHGRTGYTAANQLGMNVPSNSLGGFRGQSVGLVDVMGGGAYSTSPYYDRTSTALDLRAISSGLTLPGSAIPRPGAGTAAMVSKLHEQVTKPYEPMVSLPPGRALQVLPDINASMRLPEQGMDARPKYVISRPGAEALFAVARLDDRRDLARELQELLLVKSDTDEDESDEPDRPEPLDAREPAVGPAGRLGQDQALAAENQDIYLDLLVKMKRRQDGGADLQEDQVGEDVATVAADRNDMIASAESLRQPTFGPAPDKLEDDAEEDIIEVGPATEPIIIHGLAGRNKDMFNTRMARGGNQLKAGRYYRAVDDYTHAILINPGNPLARVGMGLTRFGAGEAFTAAIEFRKAMMIFPPIMEVRLNLAAMMPAESVAEQLKDLDERLVGKSGLDVNPQLAFLATFMHQNLGHTDQAKAAAAKLQSSPGAGKLMQAYAGYVLLGRTPTTGPAGPVGK